MKPKIDDRPSQGRRFRPLPLVLLFAACGGPKGAPASDCGDLPACIADVARTCAPAGACTRDILIGSDIPSGNTCFENGVNVSSIPHAASDVNRPRSTTTFTKSDGTSICYQIERQTVSTTGPEYLIYTDGAGRVLAEGILDPQREPPLRILCKGASEYSPVMNPKNCAGAWAEATAPCADGTCGTDVPPPPGRHVETFAAAGNRDLDILFVVDNSAGALPAQAKLAADLPAFMDVLKGLPGGLPDLHIAVVTSDLGAGRFTSGDGCGTVGGEQGRFRSQPGPACGTALLPGQTYISNVGGVTNYTGDITDVLACLTQVGDAGCRFQSPLKAAVRALGADGPAPNDPGFLRLGAYLLIVFIAPEDDCSVPIDSALMDPDPVWSALGGPLGPLQSYRCNEFGHLCNGLPPPRTMTANLSGQCVSNDSGPLHSVAEMVSQIQGLKGGDADRILVAAMVGPPSAYIVDLVPSPNVAGELWPAIRHSCTLGAAEFGDPAIRTTEFVNGFAANGLVLQICSASFAPPLDTIGDLTARAVSGAACYEGWLVDKDAAVDGLQPDCLVTDRVPDGLGGFVETTIPACGEVPSALPCWTMLDDPFLCPGFSDPTHRFEVNRAAPAIFGGSVTVSCAVCTFLGVPGCL